MDKRWISLIGCCLASAFVIGFIVGSIDQSSPESINSLPLTQDHPEAEPLNVGEWLRNEIQSSTIDAYLRHVTKIPPLAGTAEDWARAKWIKDQWLDSGLDSVQIIPYDVLLSYPDREQPNKVYLLDGDGTVKYETAGRQTPLQPDELTADVANNFIAYSANGTAQGDLVYAHYGRVEDFVTLESRGINVSGRIVMARYGKIFRGSIVRNAEQRGAIGVILFSDPQDYAKRGRDRVYPQNLDLPGMGVQSGSSVIHRGDPLTPGIPATEGAFRLDQSQVNLPRIVVQPIGYDEAEVLLRCLAVNDSPMPDDWQGGLDVQYQTGPGFRESGWKLRMQVRTTNQRAKVHNVVGVLRGSIEPDRYVIVGSHSDAWTFGAADCGSGTATLMELARVAGKLKNTQNWRPRRTILFAAWAAEEYGLIGSIEWVDQFKKILDQRAVIYINTDPGVIVNELFIPRSVPSLHQVIRRVAQTVPNSVDDEIAKGRPTLYDTWLHHMPDPANPQQAFVRGVGSGSDFHGFLYFVGVSSADFSFRYSNASVGGYPLYHTMYDTYYALTTFGDPGLKAHVALARFRAELVRLMADEVILPFDLNNYAVFLQRGFNDVVKTYGKLFQQHNISTDYFERAIKKLINSTAEFVSSLESVDTSDPHAVRRVNDQLMYFERYFIDPKGLPLVSNADHVFLSPNPINTYAALHFAPLVNLADSLASVGQEAADELQREKSQVEQHLSVLTFMTEQAAASLQNDFLL